MGRGKDVSQRMLVAVDMQDLEVLLIALDKFAQRNSADIMHLTATRNYHDTSNPLRKLINQYNASIDLLNNPTKGEA